MSAIDRIERNVKILHEYFMARDKIKNVCDSLGISNIEKE